MRTYRPSRGLIVGALGLAAALVGGLLVALDDQSASSLIVALCLWLFGWTVWAVLLWPRVRLGEREVWLVGSLRVSRLPAERIETVAVQQYLRIEADGRGFTSAVIGHSRSALGRSEKQPLRGMSVDRSGRTVVASEAERVRELIEQMAAAARRRPRGDVPPIETSWNRAPVAVLLALLLGLAVAVAVRLLG